MIKHNAVLAKCNKRGVFLQRVKSKLSQKEKNYFHIVLFQIMIMEIIRSI